jgi:signal transduction histidine kinase
MEIPLRQRLSFRQARLTVWVAVGLGVVFSGVGFVLDLNHELGRLDDSVRRTLEVVAPGAAAAAEATDRSAAREIAAALLKYPPFYIFKAEILDDYGIRIGGEERAQARNRFDWLVDRVFGPSRTYRYPIFARAEPRTAAADGADALASAALPAATGHLVVEVDHRVVLNHFAGRWVVQFASEIFRMAILAGALVWAFHRLITRPLGRMAWHYSSIDLDQPGDFRFSIPPGHKDDELGLLARAVNHAMDRLAGNAAAQKQSYFHLSREMEERRKAEQALVRMDEELRQAQRLEAAGHLAAGVAQDFNHHLTTIHGYAQLIRDQSTPGAQPAEDAGHILRACDRARNLTTELLALSRRQSVEPSPIALNDFLRERLPALREAAGGVDLQLDPAPTLWRLLADPGMVEKAVVNLVASAAAALDGKGVIRLRTANLEFPPHADGPPPGRWVCLSVEDDGPVIPREALSRVFEPFSAVRGPHKKKEGLRLATAHGIARQAGGHLRVTSHPARGTSFDLLLPMTESDAPARRPGATPAVASPSETILVVEPDPALRSLLARMLGGMGYRVLSAAKETEALDAARESATKISLLLSELDLPTLYAPELCERVRAAGHPCVGLFVVGTGGESSSRSAFGLKPESLLVKPYTQETLAQRVRETLDRARAEAAVAAPN